MLSGRYRKYFRYQWQGSYSLGADTPSGGVSMISYWAPTSIDKPVGISAVLSTSDASMSDDTTLEVIIPVISYSDSWTTGAFQSSGTFTIEIKDLELYIHPVAPNPYGGWSFRYSSIDIYLDGVLKDTIGAGTIVSAYFTPAGIPLIGVPPRVTGDGGIGTEPINGATVDCTAETTTTEDGVCQFTGGWRVKVNDGDDWQSAPVEIGLPSVSMPGGCSCSVDLPDFPSLAVTNTWNAQGTAGARLTTECEQTANDEQCDPCSGFKVIIPAIRDIYKGTLTYETWSSTFMLLPNCPKSVKRWKPQNYRQLVLRAGFPETLAQGIATCGPWSTTPDVTISNVTTPEVYPELSAYLANVGNATHTIEDPFGYDSIAPASVGRSIGRSIKYSQTFSQAGLCGLTMEASGLPTCTLPATTTCYAAESLTSIFYVQDDANIVPDHDHLDDECRLINTWFSPHASYFVWFPSNTIDTDGDGIPEDQGQWEVKGTPYPREYFEESRSQWLYQSSLPVGEQTRNRNHLPLDPLSYHDFGTWIQVLTGGLVGAQGMHSGFWGQSNLICENFNPPTSLAFNSTSEDLFSATNCTLAFGSDITVTPDTGETLLTIDIDLATEQNFATFPYLYAAWASQFAVSWEADNIDSIAVYLVGVQGTSKLLTTVTGTFARPLGLDGKYAYSYAQDYGTGRLLDTGVDSGLGGISAGRMSDAIGSMFFGLLAGRQAVKLRFAITTVNDTDPVTLHYPTAYAPATQPLTIDENGFQTATVWTDGPAFRNGNWQWMDGNTQRSVPAVIDPGSPPLYWKASLVDHLATKRLLAGEASDDDIWTELENKLVKFEEWAAYSEADAGTFGMFIDNPLAARVFPMSVYSATYREYAPCCVVPWPAFDDDKQPTGDLAQEAWSHVESRTLIQASRETHLFDDTAQVTSLIGSMGDWYLTGGELVLDNNENPFRVLVGTREVGQTLPWRGFFGIYGVGGTIGWLSADVGLDHRHVVAFSDGEQVIVRIQDHSLGTVDETELGFDATNGCIRIDRQCNPQRIHLYTVESDVCKVRISTDGGRVFGSPTTTGDGVVISADISLAGIQYVYRIEDQGDSTYDIIGRRYDRGENALEAEFTAWEEVDPDALAVTVAPISEGKQRVILRFAVGGVETAKTSQDGITFS